MQLFASTPYSKVNFYWSSQWHIVSHRKGELCHANSYKEVSALLFQNGYLGFFCLKQGEELTINTGLLHENGYNSKGKITTGALGLRLAGIKAEGWFSPRAWLSWRGWCIISELVVPGTAEVLHGKVEIDVGQPRARPWDTPASLQTLQSYSNYRDNFQFSSWKTSHKHRKFYLRPIF